MRPLVPDPVPPAPATARGRAPTHRPTRPIRHLGLIPRLACLAALLLLSLASTAGPNPGLHPTRILARYRPDADPALLQGRVEALQCRIRRRIDAVPGLAILEIVPGRTRLAGAAAGPDPSPHPAAGKDDENTRDLAERIEALRRSGLFLYVEPDFVVRKSAVPTDAAFAAGNLWGLRNTGTAGGVPGADINAQEAWDITTGSPQVIVAVVDTGIRTTHADLAAQLWRNPGEIPGNQIDDDRNGYVDDVFGIDAIADSGNPLDDEGHGTHVAGTIGAAADNGQPHVGVAWQVRLLAAKFLDETGEGYTSDAIECIEYAVTHGARIVNASWGGDTYSQALYDAMSTGAARRVLFVTAAGNDGADNDSVPSFPAGFNLDNILAVAAIDRADKLASFSNFGRNSVHLGAPGVQIFSTSSRSDNAYTSLDGTSMATPHVAGAAALLLARYPDASVLELRQRLLTTVAPTPALATTTLSGGRLDAAAALRAQSDGILEIAATPAPGTPVVAGRDLPIRIRVSDLAQVTNATVVVLSESGGNQTLADDGRPPDLQAGDATYSGWIPPRDDPSADAGSRSLTVVIQAPGKEPYVLPLNHPVVSPPDNDDFARRRPLTGSSLTLETTNRGATREPAEPSPTTLNSGGASIWFSWQAPDDGILTVDTDGSEVDTLLALFTGDTLADLQRVAADDDSGLGGASSITLAVRRGTTYAIVVDGFSGNAGPIRLQLGFQTPPAPPANDAFDRSTPLPPYPDPVPFLASTLSATREPGEPRHAGNRGGGSVWWTWTAPASGSVRLTTDGSNFDTLLAVYTGAAVASLATVAADDESGDGSRSLLQFEAAAGTRYHIAVDGYNGAFGTVRLTLQFQSDPPPPPNDALESPSVLDGRSATATASNRGATRQTDEPDHAGNVGGRSVWWSWTAPAAGRLTVSTAGSDFDTLLAVYAGGTTTASLRRLANNDQDPSGGDTSRLSLRVAAGQTCLIAVDGKNLGFGAAHGNISLQLNLEPVPSPTPNDAFTLRTRLSGWEVSVDANNETATQEIGEPIHANKPGDHSLWWTWTPPGRGQVTIETAGSDFDTVLAVYRGSELAGLVPVAADDDGGPGLTSRVTFPVNPDTAYHIAVDGFRGNAGEIRLRLAGQPDPPPPANDAFANRLAIANPGQPVTGTNRGASREPGEPEHLGQRVGRSVWWSWLAPENTVLTLDSADSDFDTLLAVYTGLDPAALTLRASARSVPGQSRVRVSLELAAGEACAIAVDGLGDATGTIVLRLSRAPVIRPVIDSQPADRTVSAGTVVAFTTRASSPTPLRYRWHRDGLPLSDQPGRVLGVSSPQLLLLGTTPADLGTYTVEVGNTAGTTLSTPASLRILNVVRLLPTDAAAGEAPGVRLTLEGITDSESRLEISQDLQLWTPIRSLPAFNGSILHVDITPAPPGPRFYRVAPLPAPR